MENTNSDALDRHLLAHCPAPIRTMVLPFRLRVAVETEWEHNSLSAESGRLC